VAENNLIPLLDFISPNMLELCAIVDTLEGDSDYSQAVAVPGGLPAWELLAVAEMLTAKV